MSDTLRENDIEFDDQVSTRSISLGLQLGSRVNHGIACENARHALVWHTKLCLGRDNIGRCHENFPIIKSVHGDWLHFESIHEAHCMGVHQVVTLAFKVWQCFLSEFDYQI